MVFAKPCNAQSAPHYYWQTYIGAPGAYGSADGPRNVAQVWDPTGVAVDGTGNLYFVDNNLTVRMATPSGYVTTLAGSTGVSGTANGSGTNASFSELFGVAADSTGNVYATDLDVIRMITPSGVVTTPGPANFYLPHGVAAVSGTGVYVADTDNCRICFLPTSGTLGSGTMSVIAGTGAVGSADGSGSNARFYTPDGVASDSSGNIYVADTGNNTIRRISIGIGNYTSTLAGIVGSSGLVDGTGTNAQFLHPNGITVDSSGNIYVADNNAIRFVTPSGVVTTIGGAYNAASIDGVDTAAGFANASGIAVDSAGSLYVADYGNNRIRKGTVPLGTWMFNNFSQTQLNDPSRSVSGLLSTPAGDGIPNLMKYALNLNPFTSGEAGLPVTGTYTDVSNNTYLTLTYTRPIAATDIAYIVEVTGDLYTWNSGPSYTYQVSVTNNADGITQTVVVQDLIPMNNANKRFIRLKVTL